MNWNQLSPEEIEKDEFMETYQGWRIYLYLPNGGILAVSISNGVSGYSYVSEFEPDGIKRYHDPGWHIEKAKAFINSQSNGLPDNCQQEELPL